MQLKYVANKEKLVDIQRDNAIIENKPQIEEKRHGASHISKVLSTTQMYFLKFAEIFSKNRPCADYIHSIDCHWCVGINRTLPYKK